MGVPTVACTQPSLPAWAEPLMIQGRVGGELGRKYVCEGSKQPLPILLLLEVLISWFCMCGVRKGWFYVSTCIRQSAPALDFLVVKCIGSALGKPPGQVLHVYRRAVRVPSCS